MVSTQGFENMNFILKKNTLGECFLLISGQVGIVTHLQKTVMFLWTLAWNKLGLIYLSHPPAVLQRAINSQCVTLQGSLSSICLSACAMPEFCLPISLKRKRVQKRSGKYNSLYSLWFISTGAHSLSLSWDWCHLERNTKAAKMANHLQQTNNRSLCIC